MSKTRLTFVEINFDEINFNVHLFRQMPNSWYFIHIYFGDILSVESLIKNSLILVRISFHGSSWDTLWCLLLKFNLGKVALDHLIT